MPEAGVLTGGHTRSGQEPPGVQGTGRSVVCDSQEGIGKAEPPKKPVPYKRGKNTGVLRGGWKWSRREPAVQITGSVQPGSKKRASKKAVKGT